VPNLQGNKDAVFSKYGVPGFLSAEAYRTTWLEYQNHLCDQLNEHTLGTTNESLPVRELHEVLSRRPADAHLYNIAAQAHHNHFFWNTLSSLPQPPPPAASFALDLQESFESLDHLRDELTDTAMSLHGNGYIWLTKEVSTKKSFRILATYNSGSPFPAAHNRRQTSDASTSAPGMGLSMALSRPNYQHPLTTLPILCLKLWEHQWLPDYGITGKEAYVANWWSRVDWDEVLNLANLVPDDVNELFHASRRSFGQMPDGSAPKMGPEASRLLNQMGRSMNRV
jgi:superoxide dismutase, Fe-Mn family